MSSQSDAARGALSLEPSYPNPTSAAATIGSSLPATGYVTIDVYNMLGQTVTTLVEAPMAEGAHTVALDASALASGTYVYRIQHGAETLTRTLVVTR